ncbi:hypothetical protein Tco_0344914, partial [Tanacetum coccineum]
ITESPESDQNGNSKKRVTKGKDGVYRVLSSNHTGRTVLLMRKERKEQEHNCIWLVPKIISDVFMAWRCQRDRADHQELYAESSEALEDKLGLKAMQEELLQFKSFQQYGFWFDLPNGAKVEVYQMEVKSAFLLYGTIDEEFMSQQPPVFVDPDHPTWFIRWSKLVMDCNQVPKACHPLRHGDQVPLNKRMRKLSDLEVTPKNFSSQSDKRIFKYPPKASRLGYVS